MTGLGIACALGDKTTSVWSRLLLGESGIETQPVITGPGQARTLPLASLIKPSSSVAALALQVVQQALADAELEPPLATCGVVVGSSRGNQRIWETLSSGQPPDFTQHAWLDSLPHMPALSVAGWLGTGGPLHAPMAACATGNWVIAQAVQLLQTGQCQQVIVAAAELPISPLTVAGFSQMGVLASTGAYPFDQQRQGLVLGEGAAALVMETQASAQARQKRGYGRVLGFGLSADGYHRSTPNPNGLAAATAVRLCLKTAGLQPEMVSYINAHGTGTLLNDQTEARLIEHLFPPDVAVSSTKGATGHTLGASGLIEAVFCLLALKDQTLPPCVGLREPAFDLNWVRVAGCTPVKAALSFSFGFGGQNAVVAFGEV
ncbi:beta-ketoacyl-ACP synthase [Leptolyngbya sp. FACHB-261]|uniref:beta-ketoacyl-ACP synthase n=1 Tax=Leptolyngbya sp. FACHB-261 TaxID=2692806 RepID=UPI0028C3F189|nr:beta-ketoacyl-ACP synthase [Leptolyngbya sp. FACHB-261]